MQPPPRMLFRRVRSVTATAVCAVAVLGWPASAGATFPGVNGAIAWQDNGAGFPIYSATPDGAFQQRLTEPGEHPAWSADGSLIAFTALTPTGQPEIFTAAPDGSGRAQLTSTGYASFPAWSPDDSKLAVASFNSGWDIWRVDQSGANLTQLTDDPGEDISPSWSPDGTKIAFQTMRDGDSEIYVMDADGTDETNVTNDDANEDASPDWSPDGTKLVFTRSSTTGGSNIVVMNASGSGATVVGPGRYGTWSPDGKRIAMLRSASGATDVYTMQADGTDVTRVTRNGGEKLLPDWQPLQPGSVTQTTVSSLDTIVFGEGATFTSTVTSPGPPLSGLLQFRVNGENEGAAAALDTGGHAVYTPPFLLDVGDVVSATYSGDAALGWSTGDAPLDVLPASTATTLVSSRNPVTRGEQTDVVVTVANTDTDIAPFGSVQFSINGRAIGPALELDENGQAEIGVVADVPAGSYTVRADYADDTAEIADFRASSASLVQQVREPTTTPPAAVAQPSPTSVVQPPPAVRKADLTRFGALIAKALRAQGFAALRGRTPLFAAATPGTLSEQIYARRGSSSARGSRVRRTLIAAGRHTFASPGSRRLRLRVTRQGKRLIRRAKRLDVEIRIRFVPTSGPAVSTVKRSRVTRRGTRVRSARARDRSGSSLRGRVVLRLGRRWIDRHRRAAHSSAWGHAPGSSRMAEKQ